MTPFTASSFKMDYQTPIAKFCPLLNPLAQRIVGSNSLTRIIQGLSSLMAHNTPLSLMQAPDSLRTWEGLLNITEATRFKAGV